MAFSALLPGLVVHLILMAGQARRAIARNGLERSVNVTPRPAAREVRLDGMGVLRRLLVAAQAVHVRGILVVLRVAVVAGRHGGHLPGAGLVTGSARRGLVIAMPEAYVTPVLQGALCAFPRGA